MISGLKYYISPGTDPYYNLAVEKYLTMHTAPDECILYLWQNHKTVVIGKNQNAWKECYHELLESDGGHLARRLSGGGAVFHDLGNLNFTFCVHKMDYDVKRQLKVIVEAVNAFGIHAQISGRNDVTVEDRKISGNAFYRCNDYCYHHGTILIDVDKSQMGKYLNVSQEKLKSKGVESIRSRVVNLRECEGGERITVESMKKALLEAFNRCYGLLSVPYVFDSDSKRALDVDAGYFSSWEWKFGPKILFTQELSRRFSWGDVHILLNVNAGRIQEAIVYSDAMDQSFISGLKQNLTGQIYDSRHLAEVIRRMTLKDEMTGFEAGDFSLLEQMKQDICDLLTLTDN